MVGLSTAQTPWTCDWDGLHMRIPAHERWIRPSCVRLVGLDSVLLACRTIINDIRMRRSRRRKHRLRPCRMRPLSAPQRGDSCCHKLAHLWWPHLGEVASRLPSISPFYGCVLLVGALQCPESPNEFFRCSPHRRPFQKGHPFGALQPQCTLRKVYLKYLW